MNAKSPIKKAGQKCNFPTRATKRLLQNLPTPFRTRTRSARQSGIHGIPQMDCGVKPRNDKGIGRFCDCFDQTIFLTEKNYTNLDRSTFQ